VRRQGSAIHCCGNAAQKLTWKSFRKYPRNFKK
jgi:hypothetical protein